MKISVHAAYAATDGATPESMTIDVEADDSSPPGEIVAMTAGFIDMLAAVPSRRHAVLIADPQDGAELAVADSGGMSAACSRILCGHGRNVHGAVDDQGQDVGVGNGACSACGNADKCRSFVPRPDFRRRVMQVAQEKGLVP